MKTKIQRDRLTHESHRRQTDNAEDRHDILEALAVREDIDVADEETIEDILSEPSRGCDCGFCETLDWEWEGPWRPDPVYAAGYAYASGYSE